MQMYSSVLQKVNRKYIFFLKKLSVFSSESGQLIYLVLRYGSKKNCVSLTFTKYMYFLHFVERLSDRIIPQL